MVDPCKGEDIVKQVMVCSVVWLVWMGVASWAWAGGEIALTFDDAPTTGRGYLSGHERTTRLIQQLKRAQVKQVVFFCNSVRLNTTTKARLLQYQRAGHLIANHSHSHPNLHRVGATAFLHDVRKAHQQLSSFRRFVSWFRYPFLFGGKSRAQRDQVRQGLATMGYTHGYVTVDNYEWYMDSLFQKAVKAKQTIDWKRLKKLYIETLWASIQFYDNIGKKVLGRSPRHVLLLHENDLAALFVGDLVAFLRSKGWKIISPKVAYQDPIARIVPNTLFLGQGRVAAIARTKGYKAKTLVHRSESRKYLDRLFQRAGVFRTP